MRAMSLLAAAWIVLACSGPGEETQPPPDPGPDSSAPVVSFLGEPLLPVEIGEETRIDFEAKLEAARADAAANPESAEAQIWLGRRLAYLGRYEEAIQVYSEAIERFPDDARLYRHRGHRYITTRRLDAAIRDFETAVELTRGHEDQIEPDGLPNALGIPTSTLQSNIWYHLGLARYLQGDFTAALEAYRAGMTVSTNPDMLVATSHWLHMTLRRLGREDEAREILTAISADMEVIENHEYHRLLLLYRGDLQIEDLAPDSADASSSAALAYGIGNWHFYNDRPEEARDVFLEILESEQWAAFGYLAAEAEVARLEAQV